MVLLGSHSRRVSKVRGSIVSMAFGLRASHLGGGRRGDVGAACAGRRSQVAGRGSWVTA